jgi:hypothetical protein
MMTAEEILDSPPWWYDSPAWTTEPPPDWLEEEDIQPWIDAHSLD